MQDLGSTERLADINRWRRRLAAATPNGPERGHMGEKAVKRSRGAGTARVADAADPAAASWKRALLSRGGARPCAASELIRVNRGITASARSELWEISLDMLKRVDLLRLEADCISYSFISSAQWWVGLGLFTSMLHKLIWPDVISCSHVLNQTKLSRSWWMSMRFLEKMKNFRTRPDLVNYNNVLSGCAKSSHWLSSLTLLCRMKHLQVSPDSISYNGCTPCRAQWQMAARLLKLHGIEAHLINYNTAINIYEPWREAFHVVRSLEEEGLLPDTITYNLMIKKSEDAGHWMNALSLWSHPAERPPGRTLGAWRWTLAARAAAPRAAGPRACRGVEDLNAMIGASWSAPWFWALELLTSSRCRPDVISFSSAMGLARGAQREDEGWGLGVRLLAVMRLDGVRPNIISYNSAIDLCDKAGQWLAAVSLLVFMLSSQEEPDSISYNSSIRACACGTGQLQIALRLLAQMEAQRLSPTTVTYNSAICVCEPRGSWACALNLLESMAAAQAPPDVVSFSSSISVSEAAGFWELALQLLNTLEISGRVPDLFSFNSAISACEKGGQLDLALKLKNCLLQQGRLSPDVLTFSSLISAAAKDRHWCTALKSLEEMDLGRVAPSLITYNSLISACGETFLGWAMALSFLNAAQLAGCRPDVITHSSSISSCHRATHWPHALTLMEQGNIISCEMLINACTADGAALGHVPRFLCTADRLGRSLCQRSLKGH
ncbi:unnamed protein product [Durusdinium trenchii]|uniref:Pentatricopeptide repeat-containing protein n=1 Tax=Durusdinium trenchii TaxID=1381693 RepID=A0ABP0MQG8_9DINO